MSKTTAKAVDLKKVLMSQMDTFTDKALAAPTPEKSEQYREIVRAMQKLFILLCDAKE